MSSNSKHQRKSLHSTTTVTFFSFADPSSFMLYSSQTNGEGDSWALVCLTNLLHLGLIIHVCFFTNTPSNLHCNMWSEYHARGRQTLTSSQERTKTKELGEKSRAVLSRCLNLDLQSPAMRDPGFPEARKRHGLSSQITNTRMASHWQAHYCLTLHICSTPSPAQALRQSCVG